MQQIVAPLFYLLLFGITGIILYRTLSAITLKLEQKDKCFTNFSQTAFKLNDIVNFIPVKLTLFLVTYRCKKKAQCLNVQS